MTSREINDRIFQIDTLNAKPYIAFADKAIPYIGWFWREVDFDAPTCIFGILPHNPARRVGFMQQNKWGYEAFECTPEQWTTIKEALIAVCKLPNEEWELGHDQMRAYEALQRVNTLIQALLPA